MTLSLRSLPWRLYFSAMYCRIALVWVSFMPSISTRGSCWYRRSPSSEQGTQGQGTQGQGTQGQGTQGQETRGQGTRGQETQGQETQGQMTQGQGTQGQGTQGQETQGQGKQGSKTLSHPVHCICEFQPHLIFGIFSSRLLRLLHNKRGVVWARRGVAVSVVGLIPATPWWFFGWVQV